MSSSHAPTSPPTEEDTARTIVYDPNDPFWRDTEDDDDDMDFVPAEEGTDDNEDGEGDLSFHGILICFVWLMNYLLTLSQDAAERLSNLSGVEIAFEYTDDNDEDDDEEEDEDDEDDDEDEEEDEDGDDEDPDDSRQPVMITREQIMQLLGHAGLGRIFATDLIPRSGLRRHRFDDDEQEDEEDSNAGTGYDPIGTRSSGRRRGPRGRDLFEKVPSEQGQELMQGGNFGTNPRPEDTLQRKKRLAYNIMRRELGIGGDGRQKNSTKLLRQDMIPESVADTIIHYNARCYSGQFSDDGNFFFSCAQDFKVRMYDTSNPYDWKYYKASNILEFEALRN